jgi:hypothetical protein
MTLLSRSDLKYYYNWRPIPDDDPRISGVFNTTLFDRNEGFEVLYLINSYADLRRIKRKETGLKIEKLIKEKLPLNLRNKIHVIQWLEEYIKEEVNK